MFLNFVSRTIIKRDMLNFVSKECDAQNGNFFKNGKKVTPLVVKVGIPENWPNNR